MYVESYHTALDLHGELFEAENGADKGVVKTLLNHMNDLAALPRCTFCDGVGHKNYECALLIKLSRYAADLGLGPQLGALKALAYYNE